MTREDIVRRYFNRDMRLLEIGPSYNPILPKADRWQTTVIDHATQPDLVAKYGAMGVTTVDRIEPVDFVWQGGPLTDLIPLDLHGQYDGVVASPTLVFPADEGGVSMMGAVADGVLPIAGGGGRIDGGGVHRRWWCRHRRWCCIDDGAGRRRWCRSWRHTNPLPDGMSNPAMASAIVLKAGRDDDNTGRIGGIRWWRRRGRQ